MPLIVRLTNPSISHVVDDLGFDGNDRLHVHLTDARPFVLEGTLAQLKTFRDQLSAHLSDHERARARQGDLILFPSHARPGDKFNDGGRILVWTGTGWADEADWPPPDAGHAGARGFAIENVCDADD